MVEEVNSFAVDENGNVLYRDSIDKNGSPTDVLKLRLADGTTFTPSLNGTNSVSGVEFRSNMISGADGKIYLTTESGSRSKKTLQLYEFATKAETLKSASDPNKKHVVTSEQALGKKFVPITPKNSISVSGYQSGSGASATHIDKAVFDLWGSHDTGY